MHLHDRAGTLADMLYKQVPVDYRQRGFGSHIAD